jgi:primosomal protein N' (replication factor Y)
MVLRRLRVGTEGVRDELERLARRTVVEITADRPATEDAPDLVVGTEAALHRVDRADTVVFLDFDQELLAPRYRAAEEALTLLARAARLVGGRRDGGRIMVQTRLPDHPVLDAVLHADPGRLVDGEMALRELLRLPPSVAMAVVSGPAAAAYVDRLGVPPPGVEVRGPAGGRWQVLAADHDLLGDTLGAVARPPGRLRIEVDPLRV